MSAQQPQQVSQARAFLAFLAVMLLIGPALYTILSETVFITSPAWVSTARIPAAIVAFVVAVLSVPVLIRMTRSNSDRKRRIVTIITAPMIAAVLVMTFALWSLPAVMTKLRPEPTVYELTVSSTTRQGKTRCAYPFSVREVSRKFCAASAAEHRDLRPGTRLEMFGDGNEWGLFVEGYRLIE